MIVTTAATSLYLYFWSFVPSLASDCKKDQKLVHAVQKQILSAWRKIHDKSPDHLFDRNFFDSMIHTITFQASVPSFLIWVVEVPRKNSFLSDVLLFSASAPVFLFAVLQSLSFLFLCKLFWAGKRNSSSSLKSIFAVEETYFIRVLTSLISLQWVIYEESF